MSELWWHRVEAMLALGVVLACIGAIYGTLAAVGVGLFCLLGYRYGLYERDRHPSSPSSEPPPAAQA